MIEIVGNEQKTIGEILAENGMDKNGLPLAEIKLDVDSPYGLPVTPAAAPKAVIDPANVTIDRGIELPERKHFKKGSSWLPLLNKMAIGDSVFFAGATLVQLGYVRTLAAKNKTPVSMRARENGVRMWRVPADKPLATYPVLATLTVPSFTDDDGLGA